MSGRVPVIKGNGWLCLVLKLEIFKHDKLSLYVIVIVIIIGFFHCSKAYSPWICSNPALE